MKKLRYHCSSMMELFFPRDDDEDYTWREMAPFLVMVLAASAFLIYIRTV